MRTLLIGLLITLCCKGLFAQETNTRFSTLLERANGGDPAAMNLVGSIYLSGNPNMNVQKDLAEAKKWFELGASKGYPSSYLNLGMLYERGEVVPKNQAKANEFYQKAAALGNKTAQARLEKSGVPLAASTNTLPPTVPGSAAAPPAKVSEQAAPQSAQPPKPTPAPAAASEAALANAWTGPKITFALTCVAEKGGSRNTFYVLDNGKANLVDLTKYKLRRGAMLSNTSATEYEYQVFEEYGYDGDKSIDKTRHRLVLARDTLRLVYFYQGVEHGGAGADPYKCTKSDNPYTLAEEASQVIDREVNRAKENSEKRRLEDEKKMQQQLKSNKV